jgi:hypothetical protein
VLSGISDIIHINSGKAEFWPLDINKIISEHLKMKIEETRVDFYFTGETLAETHKQVVEYCKDVKSPGGIWLR